MPVLLLFAGPTIFVLMVVALFFGLLWMAYVICVAAIFALFAVPTHVILRKMRKRGFFAIESTNRDHGYAKSRSFSLSFLGLKGALEPA